MKLNIWFSFSFRTATSTAAIHSSTAIHVGLTENQQWTLSQRHRLNDHTNHMPLDDKARHISGINDDTDRGRQTNAVDCRYSYTKHRAGGEGFDKFITTR